MHSKYKIDKKLSPVKISSNYSNIWTTKFDYKCIIFVDKFYVVKKKSIISNF